MMKKWRYTIAAGILPLALLVGCGDGTGMGIGGVSGQSIIDEVEPVDVTEITESPSPEPEETPEPETAVLYHAGALTPEEENSVLEIMKTLLQNPYNKRGRMAGNHEPGNL